MNILKLRLIIVVVIIMRSTFLFSAYAAKDINSELLEMVKAGNVEAVESLLEKGADVNARYNDKNLSFPDRGRTALMLAVSSHQKEMIAILLKNGADINLKNKKSSSEENALIIAVRNEFVDIVNMLIANGAHVNAIISSIIRNSEARVRETTTALVEATERGNKEIVNILLQHGANIRRSRKIINKFRAGQRMIAGDNSSETILALAAKKGHTEIATSLIKAGADDIPNFPWPPPNASSFTKIPSSFLANHHDTEISLQDVANTLETAFDHTGYTQKKYYRVPDGFALVSQLEQFLPDGTSKNEPDRWAAEFRPPRIFSLASYIKAIFTANPGQYRIVAFIVTSQPFEESKESITREEAIGWLDSGMVVLPKGIGEQPYTDEHYCTALIYEFEMPGQGKEAFFKESSELSGKLHLEKSNLWAALEK